MQLQRILIVDDSLTTRGMVRRILQLCGIAKEQIVEADDGRKAIECLKQQTPDLVLSDLHMPGMGGVELVRHMRSEPALRDIPVVVVSANPNAAHSQELLGLGVIGFLSKPFTPEGMRELLSRVENRIAA